MAINWSDPSKNSAADLDEYGKFVRATTPGVRYADVYGPETRVQQLDRAGLRDLIDRGSKEAKDELDRRNA